MHKGDYVSAASNGVVLLDGASGTWLQEQDLTAEDFGGPELEGCNEALVLSRPDIVAKMHRAYFDAGADGVETNTFGAFRGPLGEYGLAEQTFHINQEAARLARAEADRAAQDGRPRYVLGSIGPGTQFATLGQITYRQLCTYYEEQASGLLAGGVDVVLIETQYDLLGAKAAINGTRAAARAAGVDIPIQVQVTIELTGRMLPGTEIGAALTALDALRPDVIGLNCATGPVEMGEHVRFLCQYSRVPVSCLPNAGLPSVVDGRMHYDLTAEMFVEHQIRFVTELGVSVVGGCCGTTPEFIAQLRAALDGVTPAARNPNFEPATASIYTSVPFPDPAAATAGSDFLMIGERTNANGSKAFRTAMLDADWDRCVAIANEQIAEGSHLLDVCVDYVGRDGTVDMASVASRLATLSTVPMVLDSTEPEVMQVGLELLGGRNVLNSANLEDGEAEGSRLDRVFKLAREHGAAVICLLIDEEGQARTVEWKLRIAHRIADLAVNRYGLAISDLIFDALTFPLSTGDDDLRGDAKATLDAIRAIRSEIPGAHTTLGISNVSFGLSPATRRVLNSVFLHECAEAGLDSAIVHAAKIMPLASISEEQVGVCQDLIFDRRGQAGVLSAGDPDYDPLAKLLEVFAGVKSAAKKKVDTSDWTVDRRLEQRIIDGDRNGLTDDLQSALDEGHAPLSIINDVLLSGMKTVGELFGSGQMQLPFVLQSAETMKAAVAFLEPLMDKADAGGRGSIVLATVKGDVHDIGKNLVDIILTNNGYEVHNLGIKVAINEMIEAAQHLEADAIGMSGLLVKSTLIMRDNLEELDRRGLSEIPVLLGGAALTRSYVESDLRSAHPGRVFYGKDAFEGLAVMERLAAIRGGTEPDDADWGRVPSRSLAEKLALRKSERVAIPTQPSPSRSPAIAIDVERPKPPFWGAQLARGISIDTIGRWLNETALFRNQWRYRPEEGEDDAAFKLRVRSVFRKVLSEALSQDLLIPQVVWGYFPVNADGDEVIVWSDESASSERTRFVFPRQDADPWMSIADFIEPVGGPVDALGLQLVTMGPRVSERTAELFAADKYTDYLLLHGLGVEMAEALAEYWHHRIRVDWALVEAGDPASIDAEPDEVTLRALFRQRFRGGRYSFGYPACPDLEQNALIAELLEAERIGIECSEDTGWQYHPEQSTSAIVLHHPAAKYFVVSKRRP